MPFRWRTALIFVYFFVLNIRPYAISNHEPCQGGNTAALSEPWNVPFVNFMGAKYIWEFLLVTNKNGFTVFLLQKRTNLIKSKFVLFILIILFQFLEFSFAIQNLS